MTPYNQEMTNIIKGHDNCNDNDAGLLVRSSFFPTQLPVKKVIPFNVKEEYWLGFAGHKMFYIE